MSIRKPSTSTVAISETAIAADAPKVSVTVVTFNHEDFIGPCLESLVSQRTNFAFEVVVGDDASTDGTRQVIRKYAERYPRIVRPIYQERNGGVRANLEAVMRAARGSYIAHVDGDDLALPGKLQRQADLLDSRPDVAVCFHNVRVFESVTGRDLGVFTSSSSPKMQTLDDIVRYGTVYSTSSKMCRRESLGTLTVDPNTTHILDWLLHIRSASTGGIAYIDEVLGAWRRHAGGTTAADGREERAMLHFSENLYTVRAAVALGASASAAAYAESRINYAMAMRQLSWGHVETFQRMIEASVSTGQRVNRRHQQFAYRFRRWPRLVRIVTRLYMTGDL
ncbi:MAG: glycosyltransferase [Gemmatimonadaceae bacterium]